MGRRIRRVWSLAAAAALTGVIATLVPGAAALAQDDAAAQRRARVLAYWTPERAERAVPALPVLDATPSARPTNPGGGRGGGGDDGSGDGSVLGAPWNETSTRGTVGETTGKVLFTMNGSNYVCSASTVDNLKDGRSLVLTAGHCAHGGDGKPTSWATNWMFVPAYEDGGSFTSCDATTYGCWTASDLVVPATWHFSQEYADDAAFAVMDPGGKTGQALSVSDVVGTQAIAFSEAIVGKDTFAFGYPAAKKYDGTDLIYCAGVAVSGAQDGTAGLGCNMTGGSSGGPWYVPFTAGSGTAVSVNSHTYRTIKDVMFGPVFDDNESAAYISANGEANSKAERRSDR